ncbi:MAG: hypothetical protein RLZZ436_2004 [Planctomycetota bacterium]|jgi:uncharacterized membrane protein YeiH
MIQALELLGVISSALFGVLLARRKGLDFVGAASISLISAFGGGTLRDVLLDRHPLFWIRNPWYPTIVLVVALLTSQLRRIPTRLERILDVPDALGLGLFSIAGTQIALAEGVAPVVAVLFGVMTGAFGGVIGDIVCNEVPGLFRPFTPLYATCAFTGAWLLILLKTLDVPETVASPLAVAFVVIFRLGALHFRIGLRPIDRTRPYPPDSTEGHGV